MASCLLVTVILCVLITTVTIIVSFTTPSWVLYPAFSDSNILSPKEIVCPCTTVFQSCDCGLWLYCRESSSMSDNCQWFLSNEFALEKKLPVWFKAVQALMALGAFLSLLALIIALSSLCCFCKSCSLHRVASGLMNFCFLILLSAVCTFGAMCHTQYEVSLTKDNMFNSTFGWSFWLAVGATAMSLLSSLLYCGVSCADSSNAI
ncbi:uncharacterized protein LOC106879687 [Octopus bimaculoides]|nr:uncharacterized protein LOC106879687 [Octopus bimaculoides]|eukprot:XP_014784850.1 PREDICTED: uncharacterized protein LOC106879687 [Octopus bimaculoides]